MNPIQYYPGYRGKTGIIESGKVCGKVVSRKIQLQTNSRVNIVSEKSERICHLRSLAKWLVMINKEDAGIISLYQSLSREIRSTNKPKVTSACKRVANPNTFIRTNPNTLTNPEIFAPV